MKKLLLFLMVVLSQCAWAWPNGWDIGTIKPAGIVYPNSSGTTNQTLTVYQTGSSFIYTGTAADAQFTLPLCSSQLGLTYTFIDDTTNYIAVIPQSTDTIQIASTAQGVGVKNSTSTAIGNSITLICRSANIWSINDQSGTWTTGS